MPRPPETFRMTVELTMGGLDYDSLMADAGAQDKLKKKVKVDVLASLTSDYSEEDIKVTLSKGSVIARADILPKNVAALTKTLKDNKDNIDNAVLKSVKDLATESPGLLKKGKNVNDLTVSSAPAMKI